MERCITARRNRIPACRSQRMHQLSRRSLVPETLYSRNILEREKSFFLHFEAIMGKSKVWVNGKLLKEHFGGFLPVIVDVTSALKYGEDNIIAVWADNSDDPSYPPGKTQDMLDFAYFGGIYRDCWMIAHNDVYITDPNYENETAAGGLFVSYDQVSDQSAKIRMDAHIRNESGKSSTENWSMNYGTGKENRYLRRKKACPSAKERHVSFLSRLR